MHAAESPLAVPPVWEVPTGLVVRNTISAALLVPTARHRRAASLALARALVKPLAHPLVNPLVNPRAPA